MLVLNELGAEQGGMALNRAIVLNLLQRIDTFNEWGLCQVRTLFTRKQTTYITEAHT